MIEPPALRVLVTRPQEDAEAFAAELLNHNIEAVLAPVTTIEYLDADIAGDVARAQAILFTSRNGVRAFCRLTRERNKSVYAVGDATARIARKEGFEDVQSAVGDGAALVRLVAGNLDPSRGPLFHAAGERLAVDIAALLTRHGFATLRYNLYRTQPVGTLPAEIVSALQEYELDSVLHFSPAAAQAFSHLVAVRGLEACLSRMTAVCLSDAVAAELNTSQWRDIRVADRPDAGSIINLLQQADGTRTPDGDVQWRSGAGAAVPPTSGTGRAPRSEAPADPPLHSASSGQSLSEPEDQPQEPSNTTIPAESARPGQRNRSYLLAAACLVVFTIAVLAGSYFMLSAWRGHLDKDYATAVSSLRDEFGAARERETDNLSRDLAELTQRIKQLESRLPDTGDTPADDLAPRLSAMEAAVENLAKDSSSRVSGTDFFTLRERVTKAEQILRNRERGLADRLSAVEATVESVMDASHDAGVQSELTVLAGKIVEITQTLASVQESLADIRTRSDQVNAQQGRTIEGLKNATDALKSSMAGLEEGFEAFRKSIDADRNTEIMLPAARLVAALAVSDPFAEELSAFRTAARDDHELQILVAELEPYARSGVPTHQELFTQLEPLLEDITKSTRVTSGEQASGWLQHTVQRLGEVVRVRKRSARDTDLVLTRARTASRNRNLVEAVNAVSDLEDLAAQQVLPWLEVARTRLKTLSVISALNRISRSATAETSP